ncbi:sulfite exporter TauE/SafE family protein 2-like isoform X2 [Punica granatum]|uniref:Sulfite exporter TauE/SafE family protein 2-like isoform X2 n=1 Tax=Punica granatum TaxID=22663 RepID=A0A218WXX2_PUNGR|nr:sulfite exporter TauE/SafE family protein 2-like isoform X2 [Punica granatum]OWM77647.1 hypothetical protein CDL15_Pgr017047 [Punica granatum]
MKKSSQLLKFIFLLFFTVSLGEQLGDTGTDPTSNFLGFHVFSNRHFQQTQLRFSGPIVLSGFLCFVAASISSAGGIGGGGLFIPILTIVAGLDLKMASSFSAFMVTGGSVANVLCNFLFIKSPRFGNRCLIDYDIALLSEPCILLGVSIGVICNRVFPEWLITILFVIFLAWATFKTCKNGIVCWRFESEEAKLFEEYENGVVRDGICDEPEKSTTMKEPLLGKEGTCKLGFPWVKLGILVLVWFSFFVIYLLRGNRNHQSIGSSKPCGSGYWIISSLQIPLAVVFTTWILVRKDGLQYRDPSRQEVSNSSITAPSNRLIFPTMALFAGVLGGVFGIGGGMLISPLLLQVGIAPEVTAATCSFMVFFSSTMSALQYLLLGMDHIGTTLIFSFICFVGSLIGLMVVQRAIKEFGRASLIVFSVSTVMALSTVLVTGFAAVDVWNDYVLGEYMGFKSPC